MVALGDAVPKFSPKSLLLTIDTEADNPEWGRAGAANTSHVNLKALPRFFQTVKELGIRPTFFVTHSVLEEKDFASRIDPFLQVGAEIGAHLHVEETPPFGPWDAKAEGSPLPLSDEILEEKFFALHNAITENFGSPLSFRSGRWILDGRLVKLLEKYHYRVDSSVTPGISWRLLGRPDYLTCPLGAYRLKGGGAPLDVDSSLWEVPVTIWQPHRFNSFPGGLLLGQFLSMPLHSRTSLTASILRTLRPRAITPLWLRPAFVSSEDMREAALGASAHSDYAHIMLHSSELFPGTSPYASTSGEVDRVFHRLEKICRDLLERGYQPRTLGDYASRLFTSPVTL